MRIEYIYVEKCVAGVELSELCMQCDVLVLLLVFFFVMFVSYNMKHVRTCYDYAFALVITNSLSMFNTHDMYGRLWYDVYMKCASDKAPHQPNVEIDDEQREMD